MSKTFRGRTENASNVFLSAEFWQPGVRIAGKVIRAFQTENGECYAVDLLTPVVLDGESVDRISLGALTGFRMCLQDAGLERLLAGDMIHLECSSVTPTAKGSPMPSFEIEITRETADWRASHARP